MLHKLLLLSLLKQLRKSRSSPNPPFSDAHPPDLLGRENSKLDCLHFFHRGLRVIGVDGRHDAAHQRPSLKKGFRLPFYAHLSNGTFLKFIFYKILRSTIWKSVKIVKAPFPLQQINKGASNFSMTTGSIFIIFHFR